MGATSSERRTELLQTTVEASLAEAIRERAKVNERSVAAELRLAIKSHLAAREVAEAAA